ncbi:hypothetical protein VSDG_03540 [Cytospora chrysosperma]|uniref:Uncharacterized protein n=1 Tax=Cytospora chrysosperma TaxID=252740 RepID=A0A423WA39_CYTCH|nr:hypothetical protein VSDG_03540 [Valsa sordida]
MTRSNIATIISQHNPATDDNLAANELFSISRKHSILVPTATPSSSSQDQLQQPFYHSHRSTLTQSVHNKPRRDSLPPTSSSSNIHNQLPRRSSNNNNNNNAYRMASSSGSANRPRAASQSQQTTTTTTTTAADQPPTPISITICGDGGCGKSSITLRLVRSQWTSEYDPTIEDSYSVTRRVDGAAYHLALTDTAGQEEYRGMWASSNLGADAFLMVYDITSPASLEALGYFDELIDMEAETRMDNAQRARRAGVTPGPEYDYNGGGAGGGGAGSSGKTVAPVKFVAGNKCDLQESRMVSAATGLDWARKRGCGFMETSARNEVNIEETFALIVRRVVEARRLAAMGDAADEEERAGNGSRGATKPLSPLPGSEAMSEKMGARGPDNSKAGKVGRGGGGFWKKLRCW